MAAERAQCAPAGGGRRGDHRVAQIDAPAPIEQLAHLDTRPGVASLPGPGWNVDADAASRTVLSLNPVASYAKLPNRRTSVPPRTSPHLSPASARALRHCLL